jgi:hypothetical protein
MLMFMLSHHQTQKTKRLQDIPIEERTIEEN